MTSPRSLPAEVRCTSPPDPPPPPCTPLHWRLKSPASHSDVDQRKHQSFASMTFVWGIQRDRWIPRTKGQLRGKLFHLMTSSCPHPFVCSVITMLNIKQAYQLLWCVMTEVYLESKLHQYTYTHLNKVSCTHDYVIKWKHFPRYMAICAGNSPGTGEYPTQRPLTWSFDVFLRLGIWDAIAPIMTSS